MHSCIIVPRHISDILLSLVRMAGFSFQRQGSTRPSLPRGMRIADHTPSLVRSGSVASQIFNETSGTTFLVDHGRIVWTFLVRSRYFHYLPRPLCHHNSSSFSSQLRVLGLINQETTSLLDEISSKTKKCLLYLPTTEATGEGLRLADR